MLVFLFRAVVDLLCLVSEISVQLMYVCQMNDADRTIGVVGLTCQ